MYNRIYVREVWSCTSCVWFFSLSVNFLNILDKNDEAKMSNTGLYFILKFEVKFWNSFGTYSIYFI